MIDMDSIAITDLILTAASLIVAILAWRFPGGTGKAIRGSGRGLNGVANMWRARK